MRLRSFIGVILIFSVLVVATVHLIFKHQVGAEEFKSVTETTVGEFLNAKVKIDDIRVGFLNRLAFTGLNIEPDKESPYEVQIKKVIFQYDFLNLIKQRFKLPSAVIFQSPEISLPGELFPYAVFERLNFGKGGNVVSKLELVDGYIRYFIPFADSYLELQQVEGVFRPSPDSDDIQVDFVANLRGVLEGNARITGAVNPAQRSHDLQLYLTEVNFSTKVPVPLRNVNGNIRWTDDNLFFEDVHTAIHGWKIILGGSLEHFTGQPKFTLAWQSGKSDKPLLSGNLSLDLHNEELESWFQWQSGEKIPLVGKVKRSGLLYEFDDLKLNNFYEGDGWLDFDSGDYQFEFEKERQRVLLDSNLRGRTFQLELNMDHVDFQGMDLVTAMRIHLILKEQSFAKKLWKLQGTFETDYFVLQYAPLDDFRGTFEVTPYGVKNFVSSWGRVFTLTGGLSLRKGDPDLQLLMRVNGFDLSEVETFASKPLPRDLGGMLEGRLKIEGPARNPEILGNFTVKGGKLGRLDYDFGVLQFRGFYPRMEIYESYVTRGRTDFILNGELNLSLPNIFHGVVIQTPEKYAIWKGWEVSASSKEGNLEINPKFLPNMTVVGHADSGGGLTGGGEKKDEDRYVVVGPTFQF